MVALDQRPDALEWSAAFQQLAAGISRHLWINPVEEQQWGYTRSTQMIRTLFDGQMVPLTLAGLAKGIKTLR